MTMNKIGDRFVCVILAAGEGVRIGSYIPKALHRLCGKSMLSYSLNLAKSLDIQQTVVVTGHKGDIVKAHVENGMKVVEQPERLGTGDALKKTKGILSDFQGEVLVLYADTPLLTKETIGKLISTHVSNQNACTILTTKTENPMGYGRIIRNDEGHIIKILEEKDASTLYEKAINEINAGIYCFKAQGLFNVLDEVNHENVSKEYYLTDAVEIFKRKGEKVGSFTTEDHTETLGINSRQDLARAESILRKRIRDSLMSQGITILDPKTTFIDEGVQIGVDTVIHPFTKIEKGVKMGRDCEIGPFTRLRSGTKIGNGVQIGSFVELKDKNIPDGTIIAEVETKKEREG